MIKMKISIIGSGIVGQATGMGLSEKGNSVLFHDINRRKLLKLNERGYETTTDIVKAVTRSEVLFICVPTPTINRKIDLSIIQDCTESIGTILGEARKYKVVAFRSTIPPETTRTKLIPCLESCSNLKVGEDFGVCMNPEFLREKTPLTDFLHPHRIIIGEFDKQSGDILNNLYTAFKCPIIRTNLDTAEMIKYTSNLFLAAKISFFNEIYQVCKKLNINSNIVGEAVALDPRIGRYGVFGGKPFDGMCLPKDLTAFLDFADSKGLDLKLLQAVEAINPEMNLYNALKLDLRLRR
jgi:nucleotide sugar dehydrogenase